MSCGEVQAGPRRLVAGAVVVVFVALAATSLLTEAPSSDEAWGASPALGLLRDGSLATRVLEPANPEFRGIERHTYWVMPVHLVAQAAWYAAVGFSLESLRALSVLSGLVTLACWYVIVRDLTGRAAVALVACGLLAVDHLFVQASSVGRMDALGVALGSAGVASYVRLRRTWPRAALVAGHALAATAALTHPHALLFAATLIVLDLHLERPRTGRLALAAAPYALAAAAWGAYASRDPEAFAAQLRGNAFGYGVPAGRLLDSPRLLGLRAPWRAAVLEVTDRYLPAYGLSRETRAPARAKAAILLAHVAALVGGLASRGIRRDPPRRALVVATLTAVALLTVFGFPKSRFYLVYLLPGLAACTAVLAAELWTRRPGLRRAVAAGLAAVAAVQVGSVVRAAALDRAGRLYAPAVAAVRAAWDGGDVLLAPSEFAFALGFDGRVRDDLWFGLHSGRRPSVLVADTRGLDVMLGRRPEVRDHLERLLTEYRVTFENDAYRVYRRLAALDP